MTNLSKHTGKLLEKHLGSTSHYYKDGVD